MNIGPGKMKYIFDSMDGNTGGPQRPSKESESKDDWQNRKEKLMPFAEKLVMQGELVKDVEKILELLNQASEAIGEKDEDKLRLTLRFLVQYLAGKEDVHKLMIDFKTDFFATTERIKNTAIQVFSDKTGIEDAAIANVFKLIEEKNLHTTH